MLDNLVKKLYYRKCQQYYNIKLSTKYRLDFFLFLASCTKYKRSRAESQELLSVFLVCALYKNGVLRMSEVTKRIESVLSEKGISKKEFYDACGLTSSAYSQWNTGKTSPSKKALHKVSDFLGLNYEWLTTGDGEKEKAPTPEGERKATDEEIKFALFGGDGDITDAMYDEVKRFAQMVKLREEAEKKKE